jgi:EAL domain-containing protein (putative c-di-GMP-specific phosphodiesterase class I)
MLLPALRPRTAITLATLFAVASVVVMALRDQQNLYVIACLHTTQLIALLANARAVRLDGTAATVRRSFIAMAALAVPAAILLTSGRLHHHTALHRCGLAAQVMSLMFAIYGGGRAVSPLLRAPLLNHVAKVFLAGVVLGGVAMQWSSVIAHNPTLIGAMRAIAGVGTALVLSTVLPMIHRLRRVGRTNEVWLVVGATVFTVGQLVVILSQTRVTQGLVSGPAALAIGMLVAQFWATNANDLGQPLPALGGEPAPRTAATMMIAALSGSIAVLVPFVVGWVSERNIVISTAAIGQAVFLVWFIASRRAPAHARRAHASARSTDTLPRDLRAGLIDGSVVPYYQPIFRAHDQVAAGYECLVRWIHPQRGVLTAAEFLDIAAADHLLEAIDRLMFSTTLDNLDILLGGLSVDEPFVSVNIHPRRFASAALVDEIISELAKHGRDGTGLVFELTEHTSIPDWAQFAANVEALQAIGIAVAVDDFGVGHANYEVLLRCDPDIVKLDRTLTASYMETARGKAIVRCAFAAAAAVGARVIVEGVENLDDATELCGLGADFFQGYAFGRAQSFATLDRSL